MDILHHRLLHTLLPCYVSAAAIALPHTAVMIVLKWILPWTPESYTWFAWIERWAQGDSTRELEVVREENRKRCTSHLILILVTVLTIPS